MAVESTSVFGDPSTPSKISAATGREHADQRGSEFPATSQSKQAGESTPPGESPAWRPLRADPDSDCRVQVADPTLAAGRSRSMATETVSTVSRPSTISWGRREANQGSKAPVACDGPTAGEHPGRLGASSGLVLARVHRSSADARDLGGGKQQQRARQPKRHLHAPKPRANPPIAGPRKMLELSNVLSTVFAAVSCSGAHE